MAKQYYGCIRLTKHNPGWSDPVNDIHLLRTHRTFKCVLEEYDLRPIIRGINAGLIEFTRADIEGTSDADDGARLPMFCGNCICAAHLIKEGVLADYLADVDYQSSLEWQPPVAAEPPVAADKSNVQVEGDAEVAMKGAVTLQVKLDKLDPDVEVQKVPVDADGDGATDTDEEGNELFEEVEVEVHKTVTVNVSAAEGSVEPATLTFSSDPESADYFGNAKEVKFTAPEVTADKNIAIEFSGADVNVKSQNVKVKFEELSNPVVFINGKSDFIELERGITEIANAAITIEPGSCSDIDLAQLSFTVTPANGGTNSQQPGAATMTFSNLGMPEDWQACEGAIISISGQCGCGQHTIAQDIIVKVPQMGVFFGGITGANFAIANQEGKTLGDVLIAHGMNEYKAYVKEIKTTPAGGRITVALPKGCGATFNIYSAIDADCTLAELTQDALNNPKEAEVYGVPYEIWHGNPKGGASEIKYSITI